MESKQVFFLSLASVIGVALITLYISSTFPKSVKKSELDSAINQAKYLYRLEKEGGRNFQSGPCLSNALMPRWVADIAHQPRQPIDDLPENQCPAYREGRAQHFVELDTEGNLIRAR